MVTHDPCKLFNEQVVVALFRIIRHALLAAEHVSSEVASSGMPSWVGHRMEQLEIKKNAKMGNALAQDELKAGLLSKTWLVRDSSALSLGGLIPYYASEVIAPLLARLVDSRETSEEVKMTLQRALVNGTANLQRKLDAKLTMEVRQALTLYLARNCVGQEDEGEEDDDNEFPATQEGRAMKRWERDIVPAAQQRRLEMHPDKHTLMIWNDWEDHAVRIANINQSRQISAWGFSRASDDREENSLRAARKQYQSKWRREAGLEE